MESQHALVSGCCQPGLWNFLSEVSDLPTFPHVHVELARAQKQKYFSYRPQPLSLLRLPAISDASCMYACVVDTLQATSESNTVTPWKMTRLMLMSRSAKFAQHCQDFLQGGEEKGYNLILYICGTFSDSTQKQKSCDLICLLLCQMASMLLIYFNTCSQFMVVDVETLETHEASGQIKNSWKHVSLTCL